MKKFALVIASALTLGLGIGTAAAEPQVYKIDPGHTFITFEISHIGFAFLPGTFNDFSGELAYDAQKPANSSTQFTIQTASIDTEHAERDKHLRSDDFFHVEEYPTATFESTSFTLNDDNNGRLKGDLTIKGVTKPVTLDVEMTNAAEDPWGNHRIAFIATTEITLKDFNIDYELGPASRTADIRIAVEATRPM